MARAPAPPLTVPVLAGAAAALGVGLLLAPAAPARADADPATLVDEPLGPRAGNPDAGSIDPGETPGSMEREDARIAEAVRRTLAADPALRTLTVHVREGVVVLEGRVEAESQRSAARLAASAVPGVRDVRDRILVERAPREGDGAPEP